ncbi:MAG: hypothetical protein ACE5KC_01790 [Candidatus Bathyarchaeia archaeon]
MRRKIAVAAVLSVIYMFMLTSVTFAQAPAQLWINTDKAYYGYGERGTLFVTVKNNGPGAIEIRSITVKFPWHGWYHDAWDGNYTKKITDGALGENRTSTYTIEFRVPSESRDGWSVYDEAEVEVKYQYGAISDSVSKKILINAMIPVYNENIVPIYYLTAALTIAVVIVIFELYLVWRRLRKLTPAPTLTPTPA